MSQVFVSYKREDEARVGRLVRALQAAGLSVWWDQGIAGGENWRAQIENALNAAKCVIVIWTRASVGPAGDFVRDEAAHAKRRGVLVPVFLEKVNSPFGFGEIQAIDLTNWKGGARDPFFKDLEAAVMAKLEGRAVPLAKGPIRRLMRRVTYSGLASAVAFGGLAFSFNLFRAQDRVCGMAVLQPQTSDMCGGLGIGHRPTRRERLAWVGRDLGSCAALREHIERFPNGTYRDEAASLLVARHITETTVWLPSTRRLALFVPQEDSPSRNEDVARAAVLATAQVRAERLCRGFAATTSFRLKSVAAGVRKWDCSQLANGVTCGFDGEAVCELEEVHIQEQESCGQ